MQFVGKNSFIIINSVFLSIFTKFFRGLNQFVISSLFSLLFCSTPCRGPLATEHFQFDLIPFRKSFLGQSGRKACWKVFNITKFLIFPTFKSRSSICAGAIAIICLFEEFVSQFHSNWSSKKIRWACRSRHEHVIKSISLGLFVNKVNEEKQRNPLQPPNVWGKEK